MIWEERKMNFELVRELFDYQDGELIWKISKQRISAGWVAGSYGGHKYKRIMYNGEDVLCSPFDMALALWRVAEGWR